MFEALILLIHLKWCQLCAYTVRKVYIYTPKLVDGGFKSCATLELQGGRCRRNSQKISFYVYVLVWCLDADRFGLGKFDLFLCFPVMIGYWMIGVWEWDGVVGGALCIKGIFV